MKTDGLPFNSAPYTRLFWSVFAGLLMSQLHWAARHAFFYDIMSRAFLCLCLTFLAAPLLHFLFSFVIRALAVRTSKSVQELTAEIFTPFLVCFAYLPAYLAGTRPSKILAGLFYAASAAGMIVWAVVLVLNRPKTGPAAAGNDGGPGSGLIGKNWRFYIRGSIGVVRDFFFPPRLMDTGRRRHIFQPFLYPLLVACSILLIRFGHASVDGWGGAILLLLGTFAPPVLLINSLYWIAGENRKVLGFLLGTASVFYFILLLYHFTAGSPFDLDLILINKDLIFARDAFIVYGSRIDLPVLAAAIILGPVWIVLLQRRMRILTSQTMKVRSPLFPLLFLLVFAVLLLTRIPSLEEAVLFGRSLIPNIKEQSSREEIQQTLISPYPYSRTNFPLSFRGPAGRRPDVFLVIMESFDQDWVERKTPEGREVTPFINSLIPQGLYVDRFYGSSVQTSRGLFILFTGLYESFKGKTFRNATKLNLRPLPAILDDDGYRTVFFNAHDNLNFDNKGPYLRKMGFEKLVAMKGPIVAGVPKEKFWNWGIQDDVFFQKSFEWLDRNESRSREPLFAAFLTLSQHHPHSKIPAALRILYPNPVNRGQEFLNAQHLTDLFLREFFRQIEARPRYRDAIVILTSDHGFPWGRHGNFNEKGFYEESFREPLLILWKKGVKPARISGVPYDQIDIAPTIMDLLGLDRPNHFIGRSVFAPVLRRPLFMIQPYDGVYLIALDFPYKYVKHLSDDREFLFNVENDPGEKRDLSKDPLFRTRLERGRELLGEMKRNQIIIEQNRVWDPRLESFSGRR